jgi:dUTPase
MSLSVTLLANPVQRISVTIPINTSTTATIKSLLQDQGYTGEIQVIVFNTNNTTVTIPKGMKVGQGVLCPVVQGKYVSIEQVGQVENKDRGNNGFGSTGI